MTYSPAAYWQERGETYEAAFQPSVYGEQEDALDEVLFGLDYSSVLEVGCGFGRIGYLLPPADYTGIDLSPVMLASARKRRPDGTFIETSLADFQTDRKYDLVLAVEMLMHVPPTEVEAAVAKLRALSSRYVVTVDWTTPIVRPVMAHNFLHDYQALLKPDRTIPAGLLQSIHVVSL